ncbi:MAG: hypothetical protein GY765_26720 [bacterium]|nr:hypothetical protein [bacterium]
MVGNKMDINEIIESHNRRLNRKVEAEPFLSQRLKAGLRDKERTAHPIRRLFPVKSLLTYSLLLIIFVVLNFFIISSLEKKSSPPPSPLLITNNSLQADYPGSITLAYLEATND